MFKRLFYSLIATIVILLLAVAGSVVTIILAPVVFIGLTLIPWSDVEDHFFYERRYEQRRKPP